MNRWRVLLGWCPQIPHSQNIKFNRVVAILVVRCNGCGKTREMRTLRREWTPEAARKQTQVVQGFECLNCFYDPRRQTEPTASETPVASVSGRV